MRKWFKKHRALTAIAGLIAVALVAFAVVRRGGTDETVTTYTTEAAAMGTLSVTVSGSGSAYLADETEVWPDVGGEVATIEVSEGATVAAGDVLYTLASDDLDDEIAQLLTSYRQAQESYQRSLLAVMQAEDSVDAVDDQATRLYSAYLQALQGYERAALEVDQAEQSLESLKTQSKTPSSTVTPAQIDAAEAQLDIAEIGLKAAKVSRDSAWDDYQEATSAAADDQAQASLTIAKTGRTSSSTQVATAREAYEEALSSYDGLVVTAPTAGTVREVNVEVGDALSAGGSSSTSADTMGDSTASGGTASSNAPVVLEGANAIAVEIEINEIDVPGLEPGQEVEVIFDAFADRAYSGVVDEIDAEGTNTQGVVTFAVRVALDVSDDDLKAGMTASATIVTAVEHDALLVPNAALKTDDSTGAEYVEVLDPGSDMPRQQAVTSGLYSATQTIVTSGLEAGDLVVTATNNSTTTEADEQDSGGGMFMPGMGGGPPGGGR